MKKHLILLSVLFLVLFTVASCGESSDDPVVEPQIPETKVLASSLGQYNGDVSKNDIGSYELKLISGSVNAEGVLQKNSFGVSLAFTSELPFVPFNISLPAGTYTASASGVKFTFKPGNIEGTRGSYIMSADAEGVITKIGIKQGTFKVVNAEEGVCKIEAVFTDSNEEVHVYSYEDIITFEDKAEYEFDFNYILGGYWGNKLDEIFEEKDRGCFDLLLISGSVVGGELGGAGIELYLDMYSDLADYGRNAKMATGTYELSDTKGKFTIGEEDSYFREIDKETGEEMFDFLKSGYINLLVEGETHYFFFNIKTEEGREIKLKYQVDIKFRDRVTQTSISSDIEVSTFSKGVMKYFGDKWQRGINTWELYLLTDGLEKDGKTFKGKGQMLQLEINTPLASSAGELPVGTYNVKRSFDAGTVRIADGDPKFAMFFQSWFLEYFTEKNASGEKVWAYTKWAPVDTGKVTISKEDNNDYNVSFDFKDDGIPSRIHGSYKGKLSYEDRSADPWPTN